MYTGAGINPQTVLQVTPRSGPCWNGMELSRNTNSYVKRHSKDVFIYTIWIKKAVLLVLPCNIYNNDHLSLSFMYMSRYTIYDCCFYEKQQKQQQVNKNQRNFDVNVKLAFASCMFFHNKVNILNNVFHPNSNWIIFKHAKHPNLQSLHEIEPAAWSSSVDFNNLYRFSDILQLSINDWTFVLWVSSSLSRRSWYFCRSQPDNNKNIQDHFWWKTAVQWMS